ncbi:hypothetical protein ABMA79_12045 [Halobacteriovorax sp. HFRX-2_2]|uniref:hypothetical protein n=1 Tax=unclassified Halobacteriovorax TaxID=2639665 RepID=UPI003718B089
MSKPDKYSTSLMAFILGGKLIYDSLKSFNEYLKIKSIPTSKIRSAAIGENVEIQGKVYGENSLISPINGIECVAYYIIVEEYISYGRYGHWKERAHISSSAFLQIKNEGEEDLALIDLYRSNGLKHINTDHVFVKSGNLELCERQRIVDHLDNLNLINTKNLYFKEVVFLSGQKVYAIGSCQPPTSYNLPYAEHSLLCTKVWPSSDNPKLFEYRNLINDISEEYLQEQLNESTILLTKAKGGKQVFDLSYVIVAKDQEENFAKRVNRSFYLKNIGAIACIVVGIYILFS